MQRTDRVAEEIKREVGSIILTDIQDPRIKKSMVSVTKVSISSDLKYARVYVSILDKTHKEAVLKILKSASGYIRKEVGNRIRMRVTPELIFEIDDSFDKAMHISEILDNIKNSINKQ